MANTIQVRRATAATATANNVVLASGEWGYETDTGKVKIGDGVTSWNSLEYFTGTTYFLGTYTTLAALTTAHPAPLEGSEAHINEVGAVQVMKAIWDNEDGVWVIVGAASSGSGDLEYQTPITAAATVLTTQKGLNKVYPFSSATPQTAQVNNGVYVENDVINIERRGEGTLEFLQGANVRFRGVRDLNNRYFVNDPNSMVALLCRGAVSGNDEFSIIGNLKRGYTGAVTTSYYGPLLEGDVAVDVPVVGTGFSENMIVTVSVNAIQSSAFTFVDTNNIVLHLTAVGVNTDTVTVTYDNGQIFIDTDAIIIQDTTAIVYSDNFNDNSIDTTIWDITTVTNGVISEVNNNLELSVSGGGTIGFCGLALKNAVSSVNDIIIAQCKLTMPNSSNVTPRFGLTTATLTSTEYAAFSRKTTAAPYSDLRCVILDGGTAEIVFETAVASGIDVRVKYTPSTGDVTFEYWNGSAWTLISGASGNIDLGTSVKAILYSNSGNNIEVVKFDDFFISNENYTTQYPV